MLACLTAYREEASRQGLAGLYNTFLRGLKDSLGGRGALWLGGGEGGLGLLQVGCRTLSCPDRLDPFQSYSIVKSRQPALFVQEPGIGEEEMAAFLLPPQEEKGGVEEEEEEEDLLDQL